MVLRENRIRGQFDRCSPYRLFFRVDRDIQLTTDGELTLLEFRLAPFESYRTQPYLEYIEVSFLIEGPGCEPPQGHLHKKNGRLLQKRYEHDQEVRTGCYG